VPARRLREALTDGLPLPKVAKAEATMLIPTPEQVALPRTVYVDDHLIELLSMHVRDYGTWGKDNWMFGVGTLLNHNSAGHLWRRTREAAGLDDGITLNTYSHLWPKSEERTRAAAAKLWASADSVRTTGTNRPVTCMFSGSW
jgi:hypothetical protein